MKRTVYILLFLSFKICFSSVDKGFKALRVYNYFEAKKEFEKTLDKDSIPSSFGLSIIYFREDNPFFDINKALYFIEISERNYTEFLKKKNDSKNDTLYYEDISGIFEKKNYQTKLYFDTLLHIKNKILDKILSQTRKDNYTDFIKRYSDYYKINHLTEIRDSIEFFKAKKINTSKSYRVYYKSFPKSNYINKASILEQNAIYKENTPNNKLQEYDSFINKYPDNPNILEALEKIYQLSIKNNSLEELDDFIVKYPNHPKIKEVWLKIYLLSFNEFNEKESENFYNKYSNIPSFIKKLIKNSLMTNKYFLFKRNKLNGICNKKGKIIIKTKYKIMRNFSEGLALVGDEHKIAYINVNDDTIIGFKFTDGDDFKNGQAIVDNGKFLGTINKVGKTIIPFEYDFLFKANDSLFLGKKEKNYIYLDSKGNFAFDEIFHSAEIFNNNIAIVSKWGKYGLINTKGESITPMIYSKIERKNNYLFKIFEGENQGYIDSKGKILIAPKYKELSDISEDFVVFLEKEKYGYINVKDEKLNIEAKYSKYEGYLDKALFKNGYAIVCYNKNYGLIDKKGKTIIEREYEYIGIFSEGLFPFKKNNKYGYMDKKGKILINDGYSEVFPFNNGLAFVKKKEKWGAIDIKNEQRIKFEYNLLEFFDDSNILFLKENRFGLMTKKGNIILKPVYENIEKYEKNIVKIIYSGGDINYYLLDENHFIIK